MSTEYFTTLASISTEIITLVIAFYGAYLVYLRQQRDKYREELVKDFQDLDKTIFQWSILEEHPSPSWHPPMSKYLQILEKESWKESPLESLKDILEKLNQLFMDVHKKEMELRAQTKGYLPAVPALYNEVKFALHDLIQQIYREFPPPPGDYKVSEPGEIPYAVKSFVRCDFPNNREPFIAWKKRYDAFFEGLYTVYYRIKPIIDELKKVHRESARQTKKWIEELEIMDRLNQWTEDSIKEYVEWLIMEVNYYEQIFQFLGKIKQKTDEIEDKIATYDNYFYKGKWKTIFFVRGYGANRRFYSIHSLIFQTRLVTFRNSEIFFGCGFWIINVFSYFSYLSRYL